MYSTVSKKYETSFNIVTQIVTVRSGLDFDRHTVGSRKRSSYVGKRTRSSLNQLLN